MRTSYNAFRRPRAATSSVHRPPEALESRTLLSPVLLKDIMGTASGSVSNMAVAGDTVFFTADAYGQSPGLYKTDGTEAGTVQVEQTWGLAVPRDLVPVGDALYFSGEAKLPTSEQHAYGLARSDGTAAGTVIVKAFAHDGMPAGLARVGETFYFSAGVGNRELWKSDGTEAGSVLLKDINPGPRASNPTAFTGANGTTFFVADNGTNGRELWKTDGTAAGTVMVADTDPGPGSGFVTSPALLAVNGTLYFLGEGRSAGLWKSDGTAGGTLRLVDSTVPRPLPGPRLLAEVGGAVVFAGADRRTLVRYDGADGGGGGGATVLRGGPDSSFAVATGGFARLGDLLLFTASDGDGGVELWKTDGTVGGTELLADLNRAGASNPSGLARVGDAVYFAADDGVHGVEPWKTDGTAAGTVRLADINPGAFGSSPSRFTAGPDGRTYFVATDAHHGTELWATDGTPGGTRRVGDLGTPAASKPRDFRAFRNNLFFMANTADASSPSLFRSDGTPEGTVRLGTGYNVGPVLGDSMYFALDGRSGPFSAGLFKTDGTVEGTRQILPAGFPNHAAENLEQVNGVLVFTTNSNPAGFQLWRSDGTPEGTRVIAGLGGYDAYSDPDVRNVAHAGDVMFFYAKSNNQDWEPWRTDGTEGGTYRLADIRPGYEASGYEAPGQGYPPLGYVADVVVGDIWFFTANDGNGAGGNGYALWKSDGTRGGTVRLPTPAGSLYHGYDRDQFLAVLDGSVYWMTTGAGVGASELWKSDGTPGGTVMVKQFAPADAYATARIAVIGGKLYITTDPKRLWVSDGTGAGTVALRTFTPTDPAQPKPFGRLLDRGGVAYFWADDASDGQGYGPWRSDGTPGGTVRVRRQDVPPEPFDVNGMTFGAWGGPGDVEDVELYRLEVPAEPAPAGPGSLTLAAASPGQIDLTWADAAANERSYRVERSTSEAFDSPELVAVLPAGATEYSDRDLAPDTSYFYRVYAHNAGGASPAAVGSSRTRPAPGVSEVAVASSAWSAEFLRILRDSGAGTSGFAVDEGLPQRLPWPGLDRVSIRFNADVGVRADDLRLSDGEGPSPTVAAFSYDPDTFTGVWTLDRPLGTSRLSVRLDPGVRDDFGFAVAPMTRVLDPLPGDATRDGRVNALDLADVKRRLNRRPGDGVTGDGAYSIFADLNADGRTNALDRAAVKRALGTTAAASDRADFNRDGRVNALDLAAARGNEGTSLPLIVATPAAATEVLAGARVRRRGFFCLTLV